MAFTTIRIAGAEALAELERRRARFPTTHEYPFLVGDEAELERIHESAEFDDRTVEEILGASEEVELGEWIESKHRELKEVGFDPKDCLGEWPGEMEEKGSICLHKDLLSGRIRSEVRLGLAAIEQPWQLPAAVKYGAWNDCPPAQVHCAFHRKWQAEFGAQITGISGDIIECVVNNPPLDRDTALELAWEQYWYCPDIIEQGCETVNNLAATLLDSPYWYFWWD